jgi:hypothetical protein
MPSPDRADTVAMAFSRRAAASISVDAASHHGKSITGGSDDQGVVSLPIAGAGLRLEGVDEQNRRMEAEMPTFTIFERFSEGHFQLIDLGQPNPPNQFTAGDLLLGHRPVRDPANNNQVGTVTFHGTAIQDLPGPDVLFGVNAEFRLTEGRIGQVQVRKGMIAVQDSFPLNSTKSTGAIVGGTDAYRHVRGTVTRRRLDPNTVEFTFDYTP